MSMRKKISQCTAAETVANTDLVMFEGADGVFYQATADLFKASGTKPTPQVVSTGTTALSAGVDYLLLCQTGTGAITFTLPASPVNGQVVTWKDVDGVASTNNVTFNGNGKLIDGNATDVAASDKESNRLTYSTELGAWYKGI